MTDLDALELDDAPFEIPHEFELDLNCVVVANHRLTMEGIDRSEDEGLDEIDVEDFETQNSITNHLHNFYDDLRRAARRLALVELVTRLQHWIRRLVKELKLKPDKVYESQLANLFDALNKALGIGPVPIAFFADLVRVRDSVIHADSKAEWEHNGQARRVADEYRNAYGDVELTEEQLQDAIHKAVQQVKWYDQNLPPTRTAKS